LTDKLGTDPQPYFRVFNPTLQSEKVGTFNLHAQSLTVLQADPTGDLIRHFVPELKHLKGKGNVVSILKTWYADRDHSLQLFTNLLSISAPLSSKNWGIRFLLLITRRPGNVLSVVTRHQDHSKDTSITMDSTNSALHHNVTTFALNTAPFHILHLFQLVTCPVLSRYACHPASLYRSACRFISAMSSPFP